jgi:RNA polymerase sigma factor (sigma-70 family)
VRRDWIEDLYDAYAGQVLAYARRRTDSATAEEVTVDVFVVAWKRVTKVPEDEPLLWLYAVARRLLANVRRSGHRREALVAALRSQQPTSAQHVDDGPGPLLEALAELRPADREMLMLSAWEGLETQQIAAVLGCSEQAAYQRLHRARNRLRTQFEQRAPHTLMPTSKKASAHE